MGRIKARIRTYTELVTGYFKYKDQIKQYDSWIHQYAEKKGLVVNPHKAYVTNLKIWLAENEEIYGRRVCPCFETTGDNRTDQKLTCPCSFASQDIEENGTCHCNLFGTKELSDNEWRIQETRLMREYRVPLNIQGKTIDARNVNQDPFRKLDVPDGVHQLRLALSTVGGTFKMIVEKEQSAKNIVNYCEKRNIPASYLQKGDAYQVTVHN